MYTCTYYGSRYPNYHKGLDRNILVTCKLALCCASCPRVRKSPFQVNDSHHLPLLPLHLSPINFKPQPYLSHLRVSLFLQLLKSPYRPFVPLRQFLLVLIPKFPLPDLDAYFEIRNRCVMLEVNVVDVGVSEKKMA